MSVGGSSSNPDGVQSRALKLGAALLVALERRGGDAAADVLDLQHLNAVGNTVAERSVKQTILRNQACAPSQILRRRYRTIFAGKPSSMSSSRLNVVLNNIQPCETVRTGSTRFEYQAQGRCRLDASRGRALPTRSAWAYDRGKKGGRRRSSS